MSSALQHVEEPFRRSLNIQALQWALRYVREFSRCDDRIWAVFLEQGLLLMPCFPARWFAEHNRVTDMFVQVSYAPRERQNQAFVVSRERLTIIVNKLYDPSPEAERDIEVLQAGDIRMRTQKVPNGYLTVPSAKMSMPGIPMIRNPPDRTVMTGESWGDVVRSLRGRSVIRVQSDVIGLNLSPVRFDTANARVIRYFSDPQIIVSLPTSDRAGNIVYRHTGEPRIFYYRTDWSEAYLRLMMMMDQVAIEHDQEGTFTIFSSGPLVAAFQRHYPIGRHVFE